MVRVVPMPVPVAVAVAVALTHTRTVAVCITDHQLARRRMRVSHQPPPGVH